jgi:hypothetical protein
MPAFTILTFMNRRDGGFEFGFGEVLAGIVWSGGPLASQLESFFNACIRVGDVVWGESVAGGVGAVAGGDRSGGLGSRLGRFVGAAFTMFMNRRDGGFEVWWGGLLGSRLETLFSARFRVGDAVWGGSVAGGVAALAGGDRSGGLLESRLGRFVSARVRAGDAVCGGSAAEGGGCWGGWG